ncbi:MAG TPA: twin-arginine translocase TatA/TatE family subunit [Solirubrobacteraceae bacterium]|jgi:sec-independent protein translocase protein TatA|nr:twin-arginine translocase TatA/TatE family subunit [Solirubrobacteraceae bacterium]
MGLDNPLHIAFLLIVLLLVFGAKRLPELGRSLGSGMREFKDSISGEAHPTITQSTQPQPQPAPPQPVAAQAPVVAPVAAPAPAQAVQAPAEPAQQA